MYSLAGLLVELYVWSHSHSRSYGLFTLIELTQGLGIALALARDGANIAIAAKTGEFMSLRFEICRPNIYGASDTTSQVAWDHLHRGRRHQQSWRQRASY